MTQVRLPAQIYLNEVCFFLKQEQISATRLIKQARCALDWSLFFWLDWPDICSAFKLKRTSENSTSYLASPVNIIWFINV